MTSFKSSIGSMASPVARKHTENVVKADKDNKLSQSPGDIEEVTDLGGSRDVPDVEEPRDLSPVKVGDRVFVAKEQDIGGIVVSITDQGYMLRQDSPLGCTEKIMGVSDVRKATEEEIFAHEELKLEYEKWEFDKELKKFEAEVQSFKS